MYKEVISPVLDNFDSEGTQNIAKNLLHWAETIPGGLTLLEQFNYGRKRFTDPRLNTNLAGIALDNPVMLGAGWDKNGVAVRALYTLGFSGVEVGSILELGQPGNPKPRQYMIGPGVAWNWRGFDSVGMDEVKNNLRPYAGSTIPIGINIGINKGTPLAEVASRYGTVAEKLYSYASYFTINVSSPNTQGLRGLQNSDLLQEIVDEVNRQMDYKGGRKPLFLKVDPDSSNKVIDHVIQVAIDHHVSGIVATNTTTNPEIKAKYGERWANKTGGLSGDDPDYRKMPTKRVAYIYQEAGKELVIIGVGGVKDASTALEKILAGATAVQLVTAIRGEGPTVAGRINSGLVEIMKKNNINNISKLVGQGTQRLSELNPSKFNTNPRG